MNDSWEKLNKYYLEVESLDFSIDVSKMKFSESQLQKLAPKVELALKEMESLEQGAKSNSDENRMVGHYWLRDPSLAPSPEISHSIEDSLKEIETFSSQILSNGKFSTAIIVGIGGSALGPQFLKDCFWDCHPESLDLYFCDNTDPDGIARILAMLEKKLSETLIIVVSKSGGTVETRNAAAEIETYFNSLGLNFPNNAVAITTKNSKLDEKASREGWKKTLYIWDWVGGRCSITSAVGLIPLTLLGLDAKSFLNGAAKMDVATRSQDILNNPAALLACIWHIAGNGSGEKSMVILPYKDRLALFGRYLQQLVMESLGKSLDNEGNKIEQGLSVFGNKGSTDQHAYIQQLRDGRNDFFAVFLEVLEDLRKGETGSRLEEGFSSGDYLSGFLHGTRSALESNNRESILISLRAINEESLGGLVALFERAVGLYASMINVNAYNQPGVEAGKKAASRIIEIQKDLETYISQKKDQFDVEDASVALNRPNEKESIYRVLEHLAANSNNNGLKRISGKRPDQATYKIN